MIRISGIKYQEEPKRLLRKIVNLKEFIEKFDFSKPDWNLLPDGFPECDLAGLTSAEVGKYMAIVSLWKLNQPEKPKARSMVANIEEGFARSTTSEYLQFQGGERRYPAVSTGWASEVDAGLKLD